MNDNLSTADLVRQSLRNSVSGNGHRPKPIDVVGELISFGLDADFKVNGVASELYGTSERGKMVHLVLHLCLGHPEYFLVLSADHQEFVLERLVSGEVKRLTTTKFCQLWGEVQMGGPRWLITVRK